MARRTWIFLSNTFEVQTRGSSGRMLSLASRTYNYISAQRSDPVIDGIFVDFEPVFISYQQVCSNYRGITGSRKGNTLNVETLLLETLQTEIRKWEPQIYSVYPEDSPEAVAIFPNKRAPFFHGNYEQRINAIYTLADKLSKDPALSVVAIQVQSFYYMMLSARSTQIGNKGQVARLSDLRECQRVLVAQALWGIVLGRLMDRYRNDPSQVERSLTSHF